MSEEKGTIVGTVKIDRAKVPKTVSNLILLKIILPITFFSLQNE